MQKFEVGDWVIITHRLGRELCVVGRVSACHSRHYLNAIVVEDVIFHYDPEKFDETNPNVWPTTFETIKVERVGPEPAV